MKRLPQYLQLTLIFQNGSKHFKFK